MKLVHNQFIIGTLLDPPGLAAAPGETSAETGLLNQEIRRLNNDLRETDGGRVIPIVDTANTCAITDQYEALESLYAESQDRGRVVLGFAFNDLGRQGPGDECRIGDFCRLTHGIECPMPPKSRARRGVADPLFRGLAEAAGRDPKRNFHKYLLDRAGRLLDNFRSWTSPRRDALVPAIERLR